MDLYWTEIFLVSKAFHNGYLEKKELDDTVENHKKNLQSITEKTIISKMTIMLSMYFLIFEFIVPKYLSNISILYDNILNSFNLIALSISVVYIIFYIKTILEVINLNYTKNGELFTPKKTLSYFLDVSFNIINKQESKDLIKEEFPLLYSEYLASTYSDLNTTLVDLDKSLIKVNNLFPTEFKSNVLFNNIQNFLEDSNKLLGTNKPYTFENIWKSYKIPSNSLILDVLYQHELSLNIIQAFMSNILDINNAYDLNVILKSDECTDIYLEIQKTFSAIKKDIYIVSKLD